MRLNDDPHTNKLIRCCLVLLDNDKPDFQQDASTHFFTDRKINVEPYEFLNMMNRFVGQEPMRVDVQAMVRKSLRDVNLEYMEDSASVFLIEWINSVLSGTYIPTSDQTLEAGGSFYGGNSSVVSDFRQQNVGHNRSSTHNQVRGLGDGMGALPDSPSIGMASTVNSKEGAGGNNYKPPGDIKSAFFVKPRINNKGDGMVGALERKLANAEKKAAKKLTMIASEVPR